MAEDNSQTPPSSTPPSATPPPTSPEKKEDGQKIDPVEFGKLQKTVEELEAYKKRTDPVLETLASDPDLLKRAQEVHDKRLGKTPAIEEKPDEKDKKETIPSTPGVQDQEMRTSMINDKISDFETKVGIDKLSLEKQEEIRGLIGNTIQDMVDPMRNKTLGQVFNDIPLPAFNRYLDKAYKLVNRDDAIKQAEEKGKSSILEGYEERTGNIGSIPSGSTASDEVVLTLKEREIIKKAGWDEKKYIENKKVINQMRSAPE